MTINVNESDADKTAIIAACDHAFVLMEQALDLLDMAGQSAAANHLDHAINLIPDAAGNMPRRRISRPPSV